MTPNHRALSDAQATVDVLHALLSRLAPLGVTHLEDLATATDPVPQDVRRKRTLADGLPDSPGVYLFRGPGDEVLYVGHVHHVPAPARPVSYFTSAEKRSRMIEMVRVAHRVDPVPCATPLEARIRELRLIAAHSPRYNRRSRFPERMPWVRLTSEPYPRLSVVREVKDEDGATYIGPFSSATTAQLAVEALHESVPDPAVHPSAPAGGPAGLVGVRARRDGQVRRAVHRPPERARLRGRWSTASGTRCSRTRTRWSSAHADRIAWLAAQERFEEAATVRDRLGGFLRGAARAQRFAPLAACPELVAARRTDDGGWEIVLVRYGRLAGTARVDRRTDPGRRSPRCRRPASRSSLPWRPRRPRTRRRPTWSSRGSRSPACGSSPSTMPWACPVRSAESLGDPADGGRRPGPPASRHRRRRPRRPAGAGVRRLRRGA